MKYRISEEKYQRLIGDGERFNASMVVVGVVGAVFIVLCGVGAWYCGAWLCGLIKGCL